MKIKYHINSRGIATICAAEDGYCPFDKTGHFSTKEEANTHAQELSKSKFGILPSNNQKFRVATTKEDKEYVAKRLAELEDEQDGGWTYAKRCESSKVLHGYNPSTKMTSHMRKDRLPKESGLVKEFGYGEVVGFYEVNHLNGTPARYQKQIVQLFDNGRMSLYDAEQGHGYKVTTFAVHRSRIEATMLLAGQIPDEHMLDTIAKNREEAQALGLS